MICYTWVKMLLHWLHDKGIFGWSMSFKPNQSKRWTMWTPSEMETVGDEEMVGEEETVADTDADAVQ